MIEIKHPTFINESHEIIFNRKNRDFFRFIMLLSERIPKKNAEIKFEKNEDELNFYSFRPVIVKASDNEFKKEILEIIHTYYFQVPFEKSEMKNTH